MWHETTYAAVGNHRFSLHRVIVRPTKIIQDLCEANSYRISAHTFRGNYSFLNLKIQRSQYIRPKVTLHKCAEIIQGRKLYEEICIYLLKGKILIENHNLTRIPI